MQTLSKRPLCFLCVVMMILIWIGQISGILPWLDAVTHTQLDQYLASQEQVTIYGQVSSCTWKDNRQILILTQTVLSDHSNYEKLNEIRITCEENTGLFVVGNTLRATGEITPVEAAGNPGQFDAKAYYLSRHIRYTMWDPHIDIIESGRDPLMDLLYTLRDHMNQQIDQWLPTDQAAVIKAMVTGDRTELSEDTSNQFRMAGVTHILCISGLHLSAIGMALYWILSRLYLPRSVCVVVAVAGLTAYGALTGNGVSTVRALVMFCLMMGSKLAGRTYDLPTALSVAAMVLLCQEPTLLFQSSFLLSFAAVSSLSLIKSRHPLLSGVLLYLCMAPVVSWFYFELPLYSVLMNLLAVPAAAAILYLAVPAVLLSVLGVPGAMVLIAPAGWLVGLLDQVTEWISQLPAATILTGRPKAYMVVVYYLCLLIGAFLWRRYRVWKRRFLLWLGVPLLIGMLCVFPDGKLTIAMLDVGQGDGIVVTTPKGHHMLIDGGSTSSKQIAKYRLVPYLKYNGIRHLEYVLLSHTDQDHISGVVELLENREELGITIGQLILPDWNDCQETWKELLTTAKEAQVPVTIMEAGDIIVEGEMKITCLHPSGGSYQDDPNSGSMVLSLQYGAFQGLFVGDLGQEQEEELLNASENIFTDIDILKVGHHGSATSNSMEFLHRTMPEIALISCGVNNRYGHPSQETLERLQQVNCQIYCTPETGAITISTDGETIDLKTFKPYNEQEVVAG